MSFVHLHTHTHFSLFEGSIKIEELALKAAELQNARFCHNKITTIFSDFTIIPLIWYLLF